MSQLSIDPERLRVAIRRMTRNQLLDLLDRAIDLIPKSRLPELAEGYVSPDDVARK